MKMDLAIKVLLEKLQIDQKDIEEFAFGEKVIALPAAQLSAAVQIMLDAGVWHLSAITCQQIENNLELLYHFWDQYGLTLRIHLGLTNPQIKSVCPQIPGAEFYEREVHELFGVEFIGLPNPAPLLLPDDWQEGYPLRKKDQNKPGELI